MLATQMFESDKQWYAGENKVRASGFQSQLSLPSMPFLAALGDQIHRTLGAPRIRTFIGTK